MSNQEFKITVPITRAYKKDGDMWIEGIASSTAVDAHETIFDENVQDQFSFDINSNSGTDDPVVIEAEHKGDEEPMNILGPLVEAKVIKEDGLTKLYVRGKLDKENPKAVYYYNLLTNPDPKLGRPKKLGLSINGYVRDAEEQYNDELGKFIKVFKDAVLEKVGIVRHPSNPSTWVEKMTRSVNWNLLKENSMDNEKTVSENETKEVREVETVESTEVEEKVEGVTDEQKETTDKVETEQRSDDEQKAKVIVTEDGDVVVEGDVETREEKIAEIKEEKVERTNLWDAQDIMSATMYLANAMQTMEYYVNSKDWEDNVERKDMAQNVLTTLNGSVPMLMSLLGLEMAPAQRSVEKDLEEEKVSRNLEAKVDIKVDENDLQTLADAFDGKLKSLEETLRSTLDEKIATYETKYEEVTRKLQESEEKNQELVTRLSVVEKKPASTPGGQVIEPVIRNTDEIKTQEQLNLEKREENKLAARQKGDKDELLKFICHKNYLGNGEFY